jgi:hypothetical protein
LKRIQLLQEAYEHAVEATSLAPNSLSCAALRATLAINLLVEESALLNPSNKPAKKGQGMSTLDKKCQELRERFRGSIDACRTALEHASPVMVEPVITMITSTHTTCDPCSLVSNMPADRATPKHQHDGIALLNTAVAVATFFWVCLGGSWRLSV